MISILVLAYDGLILLKLIWIEDFEFVKKDFFYFPCCLCYNKCNCDIKLIFGNFYFNCLYIICGCFCDKIFELYTVILIGFLVYDIWMNRMSDNINNLMVFYRIMILYWNLHILTEKYINMRLLVYIYFTNFSNNTLLSSFKLVQLVLLIKFRI